MNLNFRGLYNLYHIEFKGPKVVRHTDEPKMSRVRYWKHLDGKP
jgi:hypothetical protein